MKKSPVSLMKEQFQSKEKLVEAVQQLATADLWIDRVSSAKGLSHVSNQKLLRLHGVLTDAGSRFGSRGKLVDAILGLEKRSKDAGYKLRLESYPLPRLIQRHDVLARKAKRVDSAGKAIVKKKAPVKVAAAPKAAIKTISPAAKKSAAKKAAANKKKK